MRLIKSSAMVASIIKTTKLDQVPSITNLGASGAIELIRWGYVENSIIIITSSIPCIRPLILSSVRKISSGALSRSYELSGPFSRRRTGPNDSRSHRSRRLGKSPAPETGSVERILDRSVHANASGGGAPESPTHGSSGITKQVEISVLSDEDPGRIV